MKGCFELGGELLDAGNIVNSCATGSVSRRIAASSQLLRQCLVKQATRVLRKPIAVALL